MAWGLPPRGISERQRRAWANGGDNGETVGGNIVSGLAQLGIPMLPDGSFFDPYSGRVQSRTSIGPNMTVNEQADHDSAMYAQKGRDAASGLMHDTALRGLATPSNLPEQSSIDKKLGLVQPQHTAVPNRDIVQSHAGGKPYEEYWDYGQVEGPGGPRDDKAGVKRLPASGDLAALSNGEAVMTAKAVESMNRDLFGGDPNGVEKYQLAVDPQAGANQTDRRERTAAVGGKDALKEFQTKNAQFFSGGKVMKMKKVKKRAGGSPLATLDDGYESLKYNVGEAIGPAVDAARSGLSKVGGAINRAAISTLTPSPKTVAEQPAAAQEPVLRDISIAPFETARKNQEANMSALERRMAEAELKGGKPLKKYKGGKKCAGGSPLLALGKSEPVRKLEGGTPIQLDMFSGTGRTPFNMNKRLAKVRAAQAMGGPAPQMTIDRVPGSASFVGPEAPVQPSRFSGVRAAINAPVAPAAPGWMGKANYAGKAAGKYLAPIAAGLALGGRVAGTDTDTYRKRHGMELAPGEDASLAGDIGLRVLGAASDVPAAAVDFATGLPMMVVNELLGTDIQLGDMTNEFLYGENGKRTKDPLEAMFNYRSGGGGSTKPNTGAPAQPAQTPAEQQQSAVEQAIAARRNATPEQERTVQQAMEDKNLKDAGIAQVGNTFVGGKYDPQAEAITAMRGRLRERENNMTNDVTSAYNAWKANPNMITEQRYRALSGQQNAIGDQNAMLGIQASAPGSILHQLMGMEPGMDDGSGSGSGSGSGKDGTGGKNGGISQLSNAVNSAKANEREDTKLSADMSAKAVELAKEFGVDPNDVLQLWNTAGMSKEPGKDVAMAKLLASVREGVTPNKLEIAPDFNDPVFLNEVADLSKKGRHGDLEDLPVFDAYDAGGLPAFFGAWKDKLSTNEKVLSKDRHIISADKNLSEDATALALYIAAQQKANAVK